MTIEEMCRNNSAAVAMLPAKGPVHVTEYKPKIDALEKRVPFSGGDERHTTAAIIPYWDYCPGETS